MNLEQFYVELESDVIDCARGSGADSGGHAAGFRENAFTRMMMDELSEAGVLESPETCHLEGGAGSTEFKVNGYALPDDEGRLDLVICLYFAEGEIQKVNASQVEKAFRRLMRFFGSALTDTFLKNVAPGSEAYAMVSSIYERQDDFDRVRLYLLTNGLVVARKSAEPVAKFKSYEISSEIWDLERFRRLRSVGLSYEPIEVDFERICRGGVPCVSVPDATLGYTTCAAILPGVLLHDLYDLYGGRLLELNVRSYLQARGKINKGILDTLMREPDRFLAYNNGITVVAEHIEFDKDRRHILALRGMQIVNGGQTTASIHRARKENKSSLDHVFVQAKLTVVPTEAFEEMVPLISRYSNTQNKVSEVDLGANNAFQIGVERISRKLWAPGEQWKWFYERARGSYQTERAKAGRTSASREKFDREYPGDKRFTKEDLARYSNLWNGLPHVVSRGGQKNFVAFMERVSPMDKGWEMPAGDFKTLIGKAIAFREALVLARSQGIPAFRTQVVNYTVAVVAEATARRIDLNSLWEAQSLPGPVRGMVESWLPLVSASIMGSAGDRNPTEWFKSDKCWKALKEDAASWDVPATVQKTLSRVAEPMEGTVAGQATENNVARCIAVDAERWFKIQLWGSKTGELEAWQCGIANTLSGYAAGGWRRKPSEKQARHGVEILRLAEERMTEEVA
jgi:hypothetical protein